MSADELLTNCQQAGIILSAQGDILEVDAPRGVLTPELRSQLAHHKAELLEALRPSRAYVTLKGGLTLPVEALELAIDLERRGFHQSLDSEGSYQIKPAA